MGNLRPTPLGDAVLLPAENSCYRCPDRTRGGGKTAECVNYIGGGLVELLDAALLHVPKFTGTENAMQEDFRFTCDN